MSNFVIRRLSANSTELIIPLSPVEEENRILQKIFDSATAGGHLKNIRRTRKGFVFESFDKQTKREINLDFIRKILERFDPFMVKNQSTPKSKSKNPPVSSRPRANHAPEPTPSTSQKQVRPRGRQARNRRDNVNEEHKSRVARKTVKSTRQPRYNPRYQVNDVDEDRDEEIEETHYRTQPRKTLHKHHEDDYDEDDYDEDDYDEDDYDEDDYDEDDYSHRSNIDLKACVGDSCDKPEYPTNKSVRRGNSHTHVNNKKARGKSTRHTDNEYRLERSKKHDRNDRQSSKRRDKPSRTSRERSVNSRRSNYELDPEMSKEDMRKMRRLINSRLGK